MELRRDEVQIMADWLDTCVDCGKMHTLRKKDGGVTWASEEDGHALRRRENEARDKGQTVADFLRSITEERWTF